MYNITVDQSSKIEYTSKDTVIAYSNHKQKSLKIKAKDKRKVQEIFREAGKPDIFVYKTFSILIYLLIRDDLSKVEYITIDREYQGKEPLIKDFLLQLIRKYHKASINKDDIDFKLIGKKSKAHEKAIETYQGKIEAEIIVSCKDVLPYIL